MHKKRNVLLQKENSKGVLFFIEVIKYFLTCYTVASTIVSVAFSAALGNFERIKSFAFEV